MTVLFEGGNVFKSEDKTPLTQRISTSEVPATWFPVLSYNLIVIGVRPAAVFLG